MAKSLGSARHHLARRPGAGDLARMVPHLRPETLHHLIRERGLEASEDLVTAATPAQLTAVLDLDLWRSAQPGCDERFDPDRFGEWLELLADAGGAVAARTIAALDAGLVVTGLSRYVQVIDPGALVAPAPDDEAADREFGAPGPQCEVGGYVVRARRPDAWDAIVALLTGLADDHGEYFDVVMQGCRRLSNGSRELDGLDDLLDDAAQLAYDVAAEREGRRAEKGYVSPADARAFLHMARQRNSRRAPAAANPVAAPPVRTSALVGCATARSPSTEIGRLMQCVRERDDPTYLARTGELAFLANALLAGSSVQSRPFAPAEASAAAAAICNLGLEQWAGLTDDFLLTHDLVVAFEAGWQVLHADVAMFAAEQVIDALRSVRCDDPEIQFGLRVLRRELEVHCRSGMPWRARNALDVIAILDIPAWHGLLGLIAECPVLPAVLSAVLDGRTGAVSATDFEFISTSRQIGDVRAFLAKIPQLLVG